MLTKFKYAAFAVIAFSCIIYCHAFELDLDSDFKPTKFSDWTKTGSYVSSTEYNARGMQPFYNITHKIMYFFLGDDPLPEGYVSFDKDVGLKMGPKALNNEWTELIKHYWGLLLVVLVVFLLAISMPVIGLCFCCCRCAGACGGRSEPFDKKHDTCRRVFLGFLLIVLATGILFGVIVAFATNTYMQWGIDDAPKVVRDGSQDTRQFLAVTSEQLDHVLVTNFHQLSVQLENILRETSSHITSKLEKQSMAISFVYLTEFLAKLPEIKGKLEKMKNITNELRVSASQLSDGLRGVKRDLLVMLTKCADKACQDVLKDYEIGNLDANGIHYDQMVDRYFPKLPDVTDIIVNLDTLINQDIASAGNRGNDAIKLMRDGLNQRIAQFTPQVTSAIKSAGAKFQDESNSIKAKLSEISNIIGNGTNHYATAAEDVLREYSPYRFYFGIAVCAVLLLILLCLVAALLCGICGKRPDGYGDDCCNKGSGSRFLMFAVALIFLTTSAMSVIALLHFLVGTVAYRGVCLPLKDPQNDNIFAKFENYIDLNMLYQTPSSSNNSNKQKSQKPNGSGQLPPFRISHVISACKANQTIYEVLRLQNVKNVHEIIDSSTQYKINQTLENLVNGIEIDNTNIQILSPEDKKRILQLGDSSLKNFNSGKFIDNLSDNITQHSLTKIAEQLKKTSRQILSENMQDVQVSLLNQALHLETYEQNLVIPMKSQSAELIRLAQELDERLRYKDQSFTDSINLLVGDIERAQKFIASKGRPFVKDTAENLTRYFASEIEHYLNMVVEAVEKRIGVCEPLARVYDAGVVQVCNKFVDPLNGYWAGVSWCVLLFLPTIIVAVKLSSLYQKSDPYPGHLVESEYLYDAYSERDHIPLANGKNKRHKNKDRRRRDLYEDSLAASLHEVPPQAQSVRDTRYSDMAPNRHWDGGPPRYQNPPMAPPASEYERPPPYYYPGATEQD